MKKIALMVMSFVTLFLLSACGSKSAQSSSADKWETYVSQKTITIGFDETFVPMGFKDKSGQYVGFDIDLANAVFEEYGIKVNWQPINWDMKEVELENGKIDLIWNGYSMTEERAKKVLFTNPYVPTKDVIITKKSSNITAIDQMASKVLGAQSGSSSYETFLDNPAVLKDIVKDNDAVQYETFTQAFIDLKNNRIDGLLVDSIYATYYLTQESELDNYNVIDISKEFQGQNFAAGARKSDKTLVENIIQAIARDILLFAMQNLKDYRIVAHVHDEIIIEAKVNTQLETICKVMSIAPNWAKELPLDADGYTCKFYKKE